MSELTKLLADITRDTGGDSQPDRQEEPVKAGPARATGSVLDDLAGLLRRFIVFRDEDQLVAVVLWVAHTHAIDAATQTPYLTILSAEKRSGKTRLLEVLARLCARAEHASGASEAGLFQLVSTGKPTLLIDEVDAIFGTATERTEALRGVLNSGNRRGATVIRGDKSGEPVRYQTFCPKLLAGIETGRLPDTIRDRSIPIVLRRKRSDATVERFLWRDVGGDFRALRDDLESWAAGNIDTLREAQPYLHDELEDDRAAEGWEPLLAIADLAPGWGRRARSAAIALSGNSDEDESRGVGLLRDIRSVFEGDVMFSAVLVAALNGLDESQWGQWHDGKGMNQRDLARLLKPYEVEPKMVRAGDAQARGFRREQFGDAWGRYVAISRTDRTDRTGEGQPRPLGTDGTDGTADAHARAQPDEGACADCGGLLTDVAGEEVCFSCGTR